MFTKRWCIKINFYKNIGNNISILLTKNNMTQTELSKKLGISKQVMTKIIEGNKAINGEEIRNISNIFGVSSDELMKENSKKSESIIILIGEVNNEKTKSDLSEIDKIIDGILDLEELLSNAAENEITDIRRKVNSDLGEYRKNNQIIREDKFNIIKEESRAIYFNDICDNCKKWLSRNVLECSYKDMVYNNIDVSNYIDNFCDCVEE